MEDKNIVNVLLTARYTGSSSLGEMEVIRKPEVKILETKVRFSRAKPESRKYIFLNIKVKNNPKIPKTIPKERVSLYPNILVSSPRI
ncbi:hypothetical protein DICTH_1730 [Dictyoglomus thermophilum H-6-12]|uniref:Uncharacterized protein n=1 Tax=Dictyoglomus thermophilum (strain ATCC 35947 / DSM 3960 / H-6-12) TaxID=309799 RepID=B5YB16_DICT6|nr:hypothetical protein DICTH_1730 [Dictyoglomus thermophilum H-6-12]